MFSLSLSIMHLYEYTYLFAGTFKSGINVDGKELWLPLANLVSICALLVWFPDNPDDTITRLLFPGSTPQNKVLRGLEKLKELEFMQKPVCASR